MTTSEIAWHQQQDLQHQDSLDKTTHPDEEHASPSAMHRHPRLPRVRPRSPQHTVL